MMSTARSLVAMSHPPHIAHGLLVYVVTRRRTTTYARARVRSVRIENLPASAMSDASSMKRYIDATKSGIPRLQFAYEEGYARVLLYIRRSTSPAQTQTSDSMKLLMTTAIFSTTTIPSL